MISAFLWPQTAYGLQWTSDRVRKVFQTKSMAGLGQILSLQSYRHIAIAISRHFLTVHQQFQDHLEQGRTTVDDPEDDILDEQAGHSSHVAGFFYARQLQLRTNEILSLRTRFRESSVAWHQFLAFPSVRNEEPPLHGHKRSLSLRSLDLDASRRQQFHLRTTIDLDVQRQILLGPGSFFRDNQREALLAIVQDRSPALVVVRTGGGKSLLWMLPASYRHGGTTIVVAPLISLQYDIRRRCERLQIPCQIWDPQHPPDGVRSVLVTPESFATPAFRTFINRLKSLGQLDRIVVDECHMLLDSTSTYRTAVTRLRGLATMEAPLLFLTATLPPSLEAEFWRRLDLQPGPTYQFRTATTRSNISYAVRVVSSFTNPLRELLGHIQQGRVIIYARTVSLVQDLAASLDCPAYYADSDQKDEILQRFLDSDVRTVIASSALGLGIDLPDIRLIVHVHTPWDLLGFAQASGRAGRDGIPSQSVVLLPSGREDGVEPPLRAYLYGRYGRAECRRISLDSHLDGRNERTGCVPGEERCDICQRAVQARAPPRTATVPSSSSSAAVSEQIYHQGVHERQHVRRQAVQIQQGRGQTYVDGVRVFQSLHRVCLLCFVEKDERHPISACTNEKRPAFHDHVMKLRKTIQFASYSACFSCGMPQTVCDKWEDGGSDTFTRTGRSCQFGGLLFEALGGIFWPADRTRDRQAVVVREVAQRQGREKLSTTDVVRGLGLKCEWAGVVSCHLVPTVLEFYKEK